MKIILDTNIWYELYENEHLLKDLDQSTITTTFLNYYELIKNSGIVRNVEKSRSIFTKMDKFQTIFEPPFVHIAKQYHFYHYNNIVELQDYIQFLIRYKKGDFIAPERTDEFLDYISSMNADFENLSMFYNEEALKIKERIKDNKKHLLKDSTVFIKEYLAYIVNLATGKDITNMDFSRIELLVKTLDLYFKRLEIGDLKSTTNDIIDFFILSYVQPGDLYITKDKKWKKLIIDSGCESYLYSI
ncbi:hypothetical protein [uncultured Chryseobacterium sp.]|uniref:hypothetical protein n=1 Tax=uncultured Chryseobacterium sp. TaxID=259322 RepID=UPI0025F03893|nr:hypothetical protein [uncultured Chryseobacterium sp.]